MSELETGLARLGLAPSLRVGYELTGLGVASPDVVEAVEEALQSGVRLVSVATGQPVGASIVREREYASHSIDGVEQPDGLRGHRTSQGLSLIPSRALSPGWYVLAVDLGPALRAGLPASDAFGAGFGNRRVGDILAVRVHVGPARPFLRELRAHCGDARTLFHLSAPEGTVCQYVPLYDGAGAAAIESAGIVVRYDGRDAGCEQGAVSTDGRRLRGILCPEPPVGSTVAVGLSSLGLVTVEGRSAGTVSFTYARGVFGEARLGERLDGITARHVLAQQEGFGLELLSSR